MERLAKARPAKSIARPDLLLTALGVLGLVLFLAFYDRAFPSAALDLDLSRQEIAERAAAYMRQRGYDLDGYESALTFQGAWMSSVYLQHVLGIPRTNDLARQEGLPLWFWEVRWFKPHQKEEFHASLMPGGTVVATGHALLEDAPGADLPPEQARALAETYLTRDRGWDLARWELVTASSVTQPGGRTDHHFEWKLADWRVGDSELRLAVDVQGEAVDGYGYWLKVPEAFGRRFAEQRNRAGFVNNLSYYLGVGGFSLVAALFFLLGHRRGVFPWHEGARAAAVVAGVSLLAALNFLPLSKAGYGTTQDYPVFWINRLVDIVISSLMLLTTVLVIWAGGRYLGRRVWPRQDRLLPRDDDRRVALGRSVWRGLMAGGVHAGYVVLFYFVATRLLGGWTPMGVPPVNLYATPLPFLEALAGGVVPAVTEEFLFRLVGIGLLLALTRRRWLAVLVPGLLWAFAHLAYVRDPIYFRGVELAFVALFYGYLFLRFDLTTTIVAHLAYNAGLTALPLLRSGELYFFANGALVVAGLLAPTVPAAVYLLRRRLRGLSAPPTPAIRPATRDDLPGLCALGVEGADWAAWLAGDSTAVLCLTAGECVVGAAAARLAPGEPAEVSALFVAPAWRRSYWGSHLVQALGEALHGQGACTLQATIRADDWALARFWDAQGWRASATRYAGSLEPSATHQWLT
jgi:hypothetical protein